MATESSRTSRRLLISFIDLTGYTRAAEQTENARLADILDAYYELVAAHVTRAGGTVVKWMGDGAMLVFPPERGDDAIHALLELRDAVAARCAREGWNTTLIVRLHAGDVVAGPFGARDAKSFDIIGREVNLAARLPTRDFAISAEAFRTLSPDGRALFKKHTPPITYIPIGDHRPSPMAKR